MNGNLLQEIERYISKSGMSASYFGYVACGNSRLVERLRKGGRVWPETEEKIREYLDAAG